MVSYLFPKVTEPVLFGSLWGQSLLPKELGYFMVLVVVVVVEWERGEVRALP